MVHLARAQSAGAWCSFLEEHKAVPYEFGAKTQSDPHAGFKDVYFGANEPWGETLHDIFTLIAHKFTQVEHYVSVVGSMNALNFLTAIRPKQIHFFDLNPAAVSWGKLLVELVRASASPQDFVSRLFARDLQGFEEGQVLSPASQEAFLQLPPSEAIRSETLAKLSEESQDVYRQVAEQVEGHKHDLNTGGLESGSFAGLFPAWDRAFAGPLTKSGLGPRMGARRSFLYGEGFLRSQWTFDQVKQVLEETPISWTSGVDFPHAFPADLLPKGSMRGATLLYAMDMWSGPSHHAARWPADRIRAWQEEAGDGGLVVVQSKGDRAELVQKLVPASGGRSFWQSWSDWRSADFLPAAICKGFDQSQCRAAAGQPPSAQHMVEQALGGGTRPQLTTEEEKAFRELSGPPAWERPEEAPAPAPLLSALGPGLAPDCRWQRGRALRRFL
ncbi:unnamed protein product [Effrenium voratum]|uniref:Uncharacterized protein n=1 Tax=Effrenium voratum TaxID=2562239 RepID=A0AA36I804_9DINO|nr:unnamed protein product [Effrenium voratum]